ncbi:MAG: serine/threonine protein kinase [Chitinispirillaceae bacterium]|nr:serine/threonine protein kinase [Chitinispirillaceae bacterium]
MSFDRLTPDAILSAVEAACNVRLTTLMLSLPSYINRVYELRAVEGTKLIVKFYRPARWNREAIADEHHFIADCQEAEIPVVPAMMLAGGDTIAEHDRLLFSLFPKRAGRQLEIAGDDDWERLGSLVARMHLCGEKCPAPDRIVLGPRHSAVDDLTFLHDQVIPPRFRDTYRDTGMRIVETASPLFDGLERIRIHGDCHRGNILDRLDEGLLLIDFDDMANGPPVQDLWLLLPERAGKSGREIDLFLKGYERFRRFDRAGLRCIEPLRAMRMIYFLAWCSRQADDALFRKHFPDWGSDRFWQKEINDLREQAGFISDSFQFPVSS